MPVANSGGIKSDAAEAAVEFPNLRLPGTSPEVVQNANRIFATSAFLRRYLVRVNSCQFAVWS